MFSCNWYISESVNPVFAQVINDMASALRSRSRDIELQVINARDSNYHSGFERVRNILARKKIWHLFGLAPIWWKIIRFHSRTVHTLIDSTKWAGYPTRLFTEGSLSGEGVVYPVFDSLVTSSGTDDIRKAVFVIGHRELPKGDYEVIDISQKVLRPEALSGIYIAGETGSREAMRAAVLTMRGVAVASRKSGWLDEILGPDGYFLIQDKYDDSDLSRIIRFGLGEKGRHMAGAARHFLNSRRSHERCAESIISVYKKVIAQ